MTGQKLVLSALVWLAVVALVVFPIVYSVQHWSSSTFQDAAVGSWLGTALGVIVGLPVGLALDRLREHALRKDRRHSLGHLVYLELEFNLGLVGLLDEALAKSPKSDSEFWNWAEKVVSGIELGAYRELGATLMPEERIFYASVSHSYDSLRKLVSSIRRSAAEIVLLLASGNQGQANNLVIGAKVQSDIVLSQIKNAFKELSSAPR